MEPDQNILLLVLRGCCRSASIACASLGGLADITYSSPMIHMSIMRVFETSTSTSQTLLHLLSTSVSDGFADSDVSLTSPCEDLLRRQMLRNHRKPLVVASPKG